MLDLSFWKGSGRRAPSDTIRCVDSCEAIRLEAHDSKRRERTSKGAPLIEPDQPGRIAVKHRADLVCHDTAFEHQPDISAHAFDRKNGEHLTEIGAHETAFGTDFPHGLRHLRGIERRLAMHDVHERRHQAVIAFDYATEIGKLDKILGRQTGHWPARVTDNDLSQSLILCFADDRSALGRRKVRRGQTGIAFLDQADHLARFRDQLPVVEHGDGPLFGQIEIYASVEALAVLEMISRVAGGEMDDLRAVPVTQRHPDGAWIDTTGGKVHDMRTVDRNTG